MKRISKVTLILIIALLLIVITVLSVYMSESIRLREQFEDKETTIENLEELVNKKDFAWAASDLEVDNLEQIISSKDELILELKVKERVLELTKETLETSLLYIKVLQLRMDFAGVIYPAFIVDSILKDGYLDSVGEQEDYFEGVE